MAVKCELCGQDVPQKARNYRFHKKLFVLFNIAYDNWDFEPDDNFWNRVDLTGINTRGIDFKTLPKKTMEGLRKDILITAGYYDVTFGIGGNLRIEAQSISYSKMGAEQFEQCYQDCLHVIANKLLMCGKADLHDMVMEQF